MDCVDAMKFRSRMFWQGTANLAEFDPDAQQELEDRDIIDDDSARELEDPDWLF